MTNKYLLMVKIVESNNGFIPVSTLNIKDEGTSLNLISAANKLLCHTVLSTIVCDINEYGEIIRVPFNFCVGNCDWQFIEKTQMFLGVSDKFAYPIHIVACLVEDTSEVI